MAAPISAGLPFGGSGGPRGDPPGPVVLPPRLHREPDGGRLRRRPADRPGPEPFRWAADLWGRQDVARSGRRYPGRGDSGAPPEPRDPVVVCPPILLRGRALGTPRHHRYYARPASRREPRRL